MSYGTVGSGSLGHLTMTLVGQAAGIDIVHVPYRGGGPMVQDAIGGHTELAIGSVAVISPHVRSGKLRAIAITGDKRTHVAARRADARRAGLPRVLGAGVVGNLRAGRHAASRSSTSSMPRS